MTAAGMNGKQIAGILGISQQTVSTFLLVYKVLSSGEPLPQHLLRHQGYIEWSCNKLGLDANEFLNVPQETQEERRDNTALAFAALLDSVKALTAAVDAIDKRLSAMQMTIAGARDDANQGVKKLVETININGDIQTKEWQTIKDKLEAIKINTKRRPWKENE